MLDRRKLVEALMTEAAIVRAGAEQCRIDLLHRRRNVNCLIEEPNLGAERLCFRGGQTLGPAQLRLCDAGQNAAAEYGGRCCQRWRATFQYLSSFGNLSRSPVTLYILAVSCWTVAPGERKRGV